MFLYNCRLLLFYASAVLCVLSLYTTEPAEPEQPGCRLSAFGRNALIGALAGVADVGINQPFYCIKNFRQEGKKWSEIPFKDPRALYRGAGVGLARAAPMAAIQLLAQDMLKQVVPGSDLISSVGRAFAAGMTSTTFGAPMEVVILHRQLNNKNTYDTINYLIEQGGYRSLMRGITAKWVRAGVFGVGFFEVYPRVELHILTSTGSKALATAGAAGIAGTSTVIITHPFDTVATRMQEDCA